MENSKIYYNMLYTVNNTRIIFDVISMFKHVLHLLAKNLKQNKLVTYFIHAYL